MVGLRRRKKQTDQMIQLHEEMMARQREELERRAASQRQQSGGSRAVPQERPRQTVRSPGWYPDEQQPGHMRWWNGSAWTDNVRPA